MPLPKTDNQAPVPHPAWSAFWGIVAEEAARVRQIEALRAQGKGEEAEDAEECPEDYSETDTPPMPGKASRASH